MLTNVCPTARTSSETLSALNVSSVGRGAVVIHFFLGIRMWSHRHPPPAVPVCHSFALGGPHGCAHSGPAEEYELGTEGIPTAACTGGGSSRHSLRCVCHCFVALSTVVSHSQTYCLVTHTHTHMNVCAIQAERGRSDAETARKNVQRLYDELRSKSSDAGERRKRATDTQLDRLVAQVHTQREQRMLIIFEQKSLMQPAR